MILCLAAAHASFSNTPLFLIKSAGEAFFVSSVNFYQHTFLATFYLIFLHLSIQNLMLEINRFENYGILVSAIIDANCENQLSYEFF